MERPIDLRFNVARPSQGALSVSGSGAYPGARAFCRALFVRS
jgi:hypothetical protein